MNLLLSSPSCLVSAIVSPSTSGGRKEWRRKKKKKVPGEEIRKYFDLSPLSFFFSRPRERRSESKEGKRERESIYKIRRGRREGAKKGGRVKLGSTRDSPSKKYLA